MEQPVIMTKPPLRSVTPNPEHLLLAFQYYPILYKKYNEVLNISNTGNTRKAKEQTNCQRIDTLPEIFTDQKRQEIQSN